MTADERIGNGRLSRAQKFIIVEMAAHRCAGDPDKAEKHVANRITYERPDLADENGLLYVGRRVFNELVEATKQKVEDGRRWAALTEKRGN